MTWMKMSIPSGDDELEEFDSTIGSAIPSDWEMIMDIRRYMRNSLGISEENTQEYLDGKVTQGNIYSTWIILPEHYRNGRVQ